jgi:hypothetical protein
MPIMDKEKRNKYFRDYYKNHPELKEYHRKKSMEYYWKEKNAPVQKED